MFLWDSPGASRLTTRTDKEGRFIFSGIQNGQVWLLITADGFAPELQKLETTTNSVSISLQRANPVLAVVHDASGHPLANALFQVTSWKGDSWLQHFGYSDAEGKFRWDSAPADPVTFNISYPGLRGLQDVPLSPGNAPTVLRLERQN